MNLQTYVIGTTPRGGKAIKYGVTGRYIIGMELEPLNGVRFLNREEDIDFPHIGGQTVKPQCYIC
ncbi:MAG: hypothetical protein LBB80_07695 [Treponema sp.]|jgi:hypothetical protein|nr:hypothetical protein [Treponema sp.]